jgi:ribosome-binding ATPase
VNIALIGLPKSGKTTIFNALTGTSHSTDKYAPPSSSPNIGVIEVPDERVTKLSELYHPKKTIYAHIEYRDYPGIFSAHAENPENSLFSDIKSNEGFVLVLRAFADEELEGLFAAGTPLEQLNAFEDEMILNDLIVTEKRLEKIELGYKRGVKTPAIQFEEKLLRHIHEHLQSGEPLRSLQLHTEEEKALRGFRFFSQKPLIVLINCSEDDYHSLDGLKTEIEARGFTAEVIAGRFEEELSKLDAEEAQMFMEDMGITESMRDRFTHLCYRMLGYISFFTVGEDEVRAWTIEKGDTAVIAAGKIHSDLARGFIRAETFQYDALIAHGSEKSLREKGLFRLEGRDYIVQDGDIINVRFSV